MEDIYENTVGLDEAGRGCLFSRVYVASVILPKTFKIPKGIVIRDRYFFTIILVLIIS